MIVKGLSGEAVSFNMEIYENEKKKRKNLNLESRATNSINGEANLCSNDDDRLVKEYEKLERELIMDEPENSGIKFIVNNTNNNSFLYRTGDRFEIKKQCENEDLLMNELIENSNTELNYVNGKINICFSENKNEQNSSFYKKKKSSDEISTKDRIFYAIGLFFTLSCLFTMFFEKKT